MALLTAEFCACVHHSMLAGLVWLVQHFYTTCANKAFVDVHVHEVQYAGVLAIIQGIFFGALQRAQRLAINTTVVKWLECRTSYHKVVGSNPSKLCADFTMT